MPLTVAERCVVRVVQTLYQPPPGSSRNVHLDSRTLYERPLELQIKKTFQFFSTLLFIFWSKSVLISEIFDKKFNKSILSRNETEHSVCL